MTRAKIDGRTLAAFIAAVRSEAVETCSLAAVFWREEWREACEEDWRFGFTPTQSLERLEAEIAA